MSDSGICPSCKKPAMTFTLVGSRWLCKFCAPGEASGCRLFEFGHENPMDPKGSTAHVRDIKARRYDKESKKVYYEQPRRTYFY